MLLASKNIKKLPFVNILKPDFTHLNTDGSEKIVQIEKLNRKNGKFE
jgi:hypothetical protein